MLNELTKATYPFNLAKAILGEEDALKIYLPGIEQALATLTEREVLVLRHRFKDLWTLQGVANEIGVTRERIRQIEAKAIRKLRHPSRNALFRGVPYVEIKTERGYFCKLKQEYDQLAEAYQVLSNRPAEEVVRENDVLNRHIAESELSIRSINCLLRAGKYTYGDVAKMSLRELMQVRNLGRKSLEEIVCRLRDCGLELKED